MVILKKLIGAMLVDSATDGAASGACGESEFFKNQRSKFVQLFQGDMPDLATMGLDFMTEEDVEDHFHGSVAKVWHHAAEKHNGELVVVKSERRPGDCQHPISDRFGKGYPITCG